ILHPLEIVILHPLWSVPSCGSVGSTDTPQSTAAKRRLIRDFKRLASDPPVGISGSPNADNIMIWNAVIFGPRESDLMLLLIPCSAPTSPNLHWPESPSLSTVGSYSRDRLTQPTRHSRMDPSDSRSPSPTRIPTSRRRCEPVESDVRRRRDLDQCAESAERSQPEQVSPVLEDPANVEAASLFKENMKEYERRVKQTVEWSWLDDPTSVESTSGTVDPMEGVAPAVSA
ncbi:hypothetical protein P7C73_g6768, partial [Tremellales sp. Uapishka_1]